MYCSIAVNTSEECFNAKFTFDDIMLMSKTIGSNITKKETNISNAAASDFFHLYLPVKMNIHFFNNTYMVYEPSNAGINDCSCQNKRMPSKMMTISSSTWRIALLEILLIVVG